MRAATPLLLHIFPSFATGGAQVRFTTIANRLGGAFRHAIFAMDGRYEARTLLDSCARRPLPAGRRGQRRHARQSASFPCRAARSAAGPAGDEQLGQHRMGVGADRHGRAASAYGRRLRPGGAHTPATAPRAGAPVAAAPCHGGGAIASCWNIWRVRCGGCLPRICVVSRTGWTFRASPRCARRATDQWLSALSPRCGQRRISRG